MKKIAITAAAAAAFALSACSGGADDHATANIEANAENQADALEAQADNTSNEQVSDALEDKADAVEDKGEADAEKADDSDNAAVENAVANGM